MAREKMAYIIKRPVRVWLAIGVFMVIMQIVIGGITRLTGSGLSITKWEIVTGTLPPLNEAKWLEEFDLYKETPQYQKINDGMSLKDFKFIYFWEFFHRLWARTMGFVFIIPFFIFLRRGWLPKPFIRKLLIVVLMAAVVASFGWIMVASGLINRPWVNAYKLTLHLSLALVLFSYLLWITYEIFQPEKEVINNLSLKKLGKWITAVICVQIILGGLMSGMKAGLVAPTWPDMNGEVISSLIFHKNMWNVENFVSYDSSAFVPMLVQFFHRTVAYIVSGLIIFFFIKARRETARPLLLGSRIMLGMLIIQFTLGVFTIINCVGSVPVGLGVLHQGGAIILLGTALFVNYQFFSLKKE
ncbi:MAG: COX15/CtaA family protein [Saprospiraceae bacterium]